MQINTIARLKEHVNLELTLIGSHNGSEPMVREEQKIDDALDAFDMRRRTRILGRQSYAELMAAAYQSHIFLQPSVTGSDGDSEGGAPVSIIDMAASGMPVVSTTHCDIPEVLPKSVGHLLADERDVSGLEERLLWLIENPQSWREIAVSGREHIEKEFNAITQGERLAEIYRQVAAKE